MYASMADIQSATAEIRLRLGKIKIEEDRRKTTVVKHNVRICYTLHRVAITNGGRNIRLPRQPAADVNISFHAQYGGLG